MMPERQSAPDREAPSRPPGLKVSATGRRKPRTFHPGAFAAVLAGGVGTLLAAWVLRQFLYLRLDASGDTALGWAITLGALLAMAVGFGAARLAKKVCMLEHFVSFLALTAAGTVIMVLWARGPGGLAEGAAWPVYLGYAAAAAFGILFFGVLGSSVGFLLGGGGRLDLKFSYEWFIARRHLLAKKRTTFLSVVTIIAIGGVAVSVWVLVVVLSVMSGFEEDLKAKILGTNAHAVVLKYATNFREWEKVADEIRSVPGVEGVSPFIWGEGMVSSETQTAGAILKGIDPERVGEVTELPENVIEGDLSLLDAPERIDDWLAEHGGSDRALPPEPGDSDAKLPAIAIGQELARSLRLFVGDRINVVQPLTQDMGPMGPVPRTRAFRVAAVFYTGMYEYDSKFAYLSLSEAQRFFDLKGAVTGLELRTSDIDDTRAVAARVMRRIEGYPYYVKDWSEMNKNLFSALKLEKLVMAVILAFIVLVASFVILATLIMMVMEKGKEIAILKSMGVRDASVMKVFVLEGVTVGVIGTLLGLGLGLGTCALIASGIIRLDPEVYYIDTLPVVVEPLQVVLVSLIALVLSYLATIYPSLTASRLHPVEGLRDE